MLVGQPFTINQWAISVAFTCNCKSPGVVLQIVGQVGSVTACPECKRGYRLKHFALDGGLMSFSFEIGRAEVIPGRNLTAGG